MRKIPKRLKKQYIEACNELILMYRRDGKGTCPLCSVARVYYYALSRKGRKKMGFDYCETCPWVLFTGHVCLSARFEEYPFDSRIQRLTGWVEIMEKE